MHIVIESVDNGWIVTTSSEFEEDKEVVSVFQVAEGEGLNNEVESAQEMLRFIVEALGLAGGRYDKQCIRIVLEPGDKYEASEEEK